MAALRSDGSTMFLSSSSHIIERRQRLIKKPLLLDLADVPDENFVARLHDLLEDDPVSLPILLSLLVEGLFGCADSRVKHTNMSELGCT